MVSSIFAEEITNVLLSYMGLKPNLAFNSFNLQSFLHLNPSLYVLFSIYINPIGTVLFYLVVAPFPSITFDSHILEQ